MVKYSFLVPVYNVENYLKKCIESIIVQKDFTSNCELILVDDGSTDLSGEICDSFVQKYQNVTVVHQENKGLIQSRRIGIENSKGEYLIFIDSDDYIEKNLVSVIDCYIEKYTPDFLMYNYYKTINGEDFPQNRIDEKSGAHHLQELSGSRSSDASD